MPFTSMPSAAMHTDPTLLATVIIGTAIVPLFFFGVTSFVKISVVFSIVRNALGGHQIPSQAVTSVLALALTAHIMLPVGEEIVAGWAKGREAAPDAHAEGPKPAKRSGKQVEGGEKIENTVSEVLAAMKPLEEFLKKFSFPREREFFTKRPDGSQRTESVFTLIPAFLLSELSRAFSIGVMVFLPFLVIDLVVTNLLIALGMTMTNPMTITFPVKLLLFVASDGWFLLCRSLILSYR